MKHLIIFATGNKGKIREIRDIITYPDTQVLSMKEAGVAADPDENGTTFEANAMIKVRAVAEVMDLYTDNPSALIAVLGAVGDADIFVNEE